MEELNKDPIDIYCRIKPLNDEAAECCIKRIDCESVILNPDASQNYRSIKEVEYKFKEVFNSFTTQKSLFEKVGLTLIQDLFKGHNGLLFVSGFESSGKSYSMTGVPNNCGILPRSLDVIFNSIDDLQAKKFIFKPSTSSGLLIRSKAKASIKRQSESIMKLFRKKAAKNKREVIGDWCSRIADTTTIDVIPDMNFSVFVSYIDIYNNQIYDLLENTPIDERRKNLKSKMIREDGARNMYVFGVTEAEVKSSEEALEQFFKGQQRRTVSHTALNIKSSHSVFTIRVVQAPLDQQKKTILCKRDKIIISHLSLVDLAGSESSYRIQNTDQKLEEAGNNNNSLRVLRHCIKVLKENQAQGTKKMIPYEESKLTTLFKTYFEGEGAMKMLVCINPELDHVLKTIQVLKFAGSTVDIMFNTNIHSTPIVLGLRSRHYQMNRKVSDKNKERKNKDDECRSNLIAVDTENIQMKQESVVLEMNLDGKDQQGRRLEQELSPSEEAAVESFHRQNEEYLRQAESAAMDKRRVAAEDAEIERKTSLQVTNFRQQRKILKGDYLDNFDEFNDGHILCNPSTSSSFDIPVPMNLCKRLEDNADSSAEIRFTKTGSGSEFVYDSTDMDSSFNEFERPPNESQGPQEENILF